MPSNTGQFVFQSDGDGGRAAGILCVQLFVRELETKSQVTYYWVNYNELTTSSLEIIVSKGNHPQMALIQVSELL